MNFRVLAKYIRVCLVQAAVTGYVRVLTTACRRRYAAVHIIIPVQKWGVCEASTGSRRELTQELTSMSARAWGDGESR